MNVNTIQVDAKKLKAARGARLIQDVAKAIAVSRQTLWQVESGNSVPNADIFARLCVLYGISIKDVISNGETKRNKSRPSRRSHVRLSRK